MSLRLTTEFQGIISRDYQVISSKRDRLDPTNAAAVEAGEFAALSSVAGERDFIDLGALTGTIGTGVAGASLPTNEALLYQVFTERGRSDVQAIDKITTLWGKPYEGDTNVFENTAGISFGQPLTVKLGVKSAVSARLVLSPALAGDLVYGFALNALAGSVDPLGTPNLAFRFEGPLFVAA